MAAALQSLSLLITHSGYDLLEFVIKICSLGVENVGLILDGLIGNLRLE